MVTRLRTVLATITSLLIMAAGMTLATAAHADDIITTQGFVTPTGLDQLKAQGWDGTGVTIAVIDSDIDTTVPELAGADIDVKATCQVGGTYHGTAILSILADPVWGWAPKAHYLAYSTANTWDPTGQDASPDGCEGTLTDMVNRAINDGVDIINISGGMFSIDNYSLVRAALLGIPVVVAAGNYGVEEIGGASAHISSPLNSIVSVGSTDLTGNRYPYSEYGFGLTIMAPGDHTCRHPAAPDSDHAPLTVLTQCSGTSGATPMVTGALALAMQKWPQANGNQLISSLIATANRPSTQWDTYYGWGTFNPTALISNDPAQFSTENPLQNAVPDHDPTPQDFADYENGTIEFASVLNQYDHDYVPGIGFHPGGATAETPSAAATPGATATPGTASTTSSGWITPVTIIGGGIILVLLIVLIVILLARRRPTPGPATSARSPQPPPGYPPAQPGPTTAPTGYPPSPPAPVPGSMPPWSYPPSAPPRHSA